MARYPFNLDDCPDSKYAAELRKPVTTQPFPPAMEQDYLDDHLRRTQPRIRAWTAVATLLALGFTVARGLQDGATSLAFLGHLFVILPAALAIAWLGWSSNRRRAYLQAATLLAPVLGVAVALAVAQAVERGAAEEMGTLTLLLIASFFLLGLTLRAAVVAGTAILLGFATGAYAVGMPVPLFAKCFLFLAVAAAIGAAICREVERSYRKQFLEENLIRELVDRDGLTGLRNRRAFEEHMQRVWQQSLRGHKAVAFFMIDVDHFKAYNDRYGHQAGDATLRKVADVVTQYGRRPFDIAARYGGEEFAIIVYDVSALAVGDIAEGLRQAVENLNIENADSACSHYVTVSIGVAMVQPALGRTPKGAMQLADEALYRAKAAGRNRCSIVGQAEYETLVTGSYRNPGTAKQEA